MEIVVFEFKELCHLPSMHGAIDGTHGYWVLNVFGDRPIKVAHCKQKKKTLKTFVF